MARKKPKRETERTAMDDLKEIDLIESLTASTKYIRELLESKTLFVLPENLIRPIAEQLLTDDLGAPVTEVSDIDVKNYVIQALKDHLQADYGRNHTAEQLVLFKQKYGLTD